MFLQKRATLESVVILLAVWLLRFWALKHQRYATRSILGVVDVAEIGGISDRAVQRYYVRDFPNAIKVGQAYAIPTSDVEAFLARVNAKEKASLTRNCVRPTRTTRNCEARHPRQGQTCIHIPYNRIALEPGPYGIDLFPFCLTF